MLDGLKVKVDVNLRPVEMVRPRLLDLEHRRNWGLAEPWELGEGQEQLAPIDEEPEPVAGDVGHLN